MRIPRFYFDTIVTGCVELGKAESRHLVKVLRAGLADTVELFDGRGKLAKATIVEINKNNTTVNVEKIESAPPSQTGRIIIAVSMPKAARFDWIITRCTELGVDRIVPVLFERTVKQADKAASTQRRDKLAIEAAKQCGRLFLPLIDSIVPLTKAISSLKVKYPNANMLFGSLSENAKSIMEIDSDEKDVIAFVGPEGGMTAGEENLLVQNAAVPVRIGGNILRIETCAMAIAAIMTAKRGAKT